MGPTEISTTQILVRSYSWFMHASMNKPNTNVRYQIKMTKRNHFNQTILKWCCNSTVFINQKTVDTTLPSATCNSIYYTLKDWMFVLWQSVYAKSTNTFSIYLKSFSYKGPKVNWLRKPICFTISFDAFKLQTQYNTIIKWSTYNVENLHIITIKLESIEVCMTAAIKADKPIICKKVKTGISK